MVQNLDQIINKQKEFFRSGATFSIGFRIYMLKKLYNIIKNNEEEIAYKLVKENCKALDPNFSTLIKESTSRLQGAMFYNN